MTDGQAPEDRYRFDYEPPKTKLYVQVTGIPHAVLVGECDGFDYSYEGVVTQTGIECEWTLTVRDPNPELLRGLGFRFPGDHPPAPQEVPPTAEIPAAAPEAAPEPAPTPAGATRATPQPDGADPDQAATTIIVTEETTTS